MDLYSLIISALLVVTTATIAMGVVYATRRTYAGFGWWFAAAIARAGSLLFFLLPHDRFSPWLSIVLPNMCLAWESMFELQGMKAFRGRSTGRWWMLLLSAAFFAGLVQYSIVASDIAARILLRSVLLAALMIWTFQVAVTRRPPYFGAADVMTAVPLAVAFVFNAFVAAEAWRLSGTMPEAALVNTIMGGEAGTLVLTAVTLLATLGQILMHQQRLAWDQQQVEEELERDIEARKEVERRLRDSEARMRSYFDQPVVGISITSIEHGRIEVNDRFCEMLGYTREQLASKTWMDLTHPDDLETDRTLLQQLLRGEREAYSLDKRYVRADGTILHAMLGVACVYKEDGSPDYFLAAIQDISESKRIEEQLRISEERHRLIAESARDVLWTMSPQGEITYISPSVETVRGYTPEEAVRQTSDEIYPPESRAISIAYFSGLRRALAEGRPLENFRGDLEYKCKDGSTFWTEVMAFPIRRADGSVEILGVTRDLSKRKLAEAHRAEMDAARLRIEKSESLARMAGAVSHHLNNQLMVVAGYLEMAMAKGEQGPLPQAELDRLLSRSLEATHEAARVGEMLSTYLGHMPSERRRFDLAELGRKRSGELYATVPAGIDLVTEFPLPGPVVMADPDQMAMLLSRLVANACESRNHGSNSVRVSVRTCPTSSIPARHRFPVDFHETAGEWACLEVSDCGGGIAEDQIEKIFDPFYTTKLTGRGLGLATVLGIVRSHHGVVTVESRVGEGTVVRVFLPLAGAESQSLAAC